MPSSTSSSDERLSGGPWLRCWGLTALIVIVAMGMWEWTVRARGWEPSISRYSSSLEPSWAVARTEASLRNAETWLFLGSSRMENDVVPEIFDREMKTETVLLTMGGSSPLPVLEALADNPDVRNPILMGVNPLFIFDADRTTEARAYEWMDYHKRMEWGRILEQYLRIQWVGRVAYRNPLILPHRFWPPVPRNRHWPSVPHFFVQRDRSCQADRSSFTPLPWSEARNLWEWRAYQNEYYRTEGRVPTAPQLGERIERIASAVRQIEDRGGRVVFVRLPTSRALRASEAERFPRERFWDALIEATGAPGIHFEDHPELARHECTDNSHLDYMEARPFTEALVPILRGKIAQHDLETETKKSRPSGPGLF